jgi:tetratricopeptide (TPR) repeat protein
VAIDPRLVDAYSNLGSAHLMLGNLDRARTVLRKALGIKPDNLAACLGEITVHEREGDYQGAWERLSPVIRRGTEVPDVAISYLSLCHRIDRCEDAIDFAQRVLENRELSPQSESHLRFSLGQVYDRLGEYDEAFSQYHRANTLLPDNFGAVEYVGTIDAIIRVFNWQFFTAAPRATVRSSRPFFIVGMPRSGTSLTEQILASHPEVHGAGELGIMDDIVNAIPALLDKEIGYPFNAARLSAEMLGELANIYLDQLAKLAPEAARVTDKMPQNFLLLGLIALLFPDARIVHCKRSPLDTCLSIYFQDFSESHRYANRLENIGLYYRQYEKLMQHFGGLLDIPILEVSYEELVTNQEEITRKLIDFAGLEWDDCCLAFHKTSRFIPTASYDQVRQKMYTRSVGRWKHYEKHLGPLMETLGLA